MGQFLVIYSESTSESQEFRFCTGKPHLTVEAPPQVADAPVYDTPQEYFDEERRVWTVPNSFLAKYRGFERRNKKSGYHGQYIVIEDWPEVIRAAAHGQPNHVRFWKDENGVYQAETYIDSDSLREAYHWDRRFLRQNTLLTPLTATIGGRSVRVKRPTRISVNDHHLPGLQHLERLLTLPDSEYESSAPLMNIDGGGTFKPSKAELRALIQAEAADHKLAHEKSAATEAEIERLYAGATAEIPDGAGPNSDAVTNRNGFLRLLRGFNVQSYWAIAPPAKPLFSVIQAPPAPAPAPEAGE